LDKVFAAVQTGTYGYDLINDNWGDMAAMTSAGAFSNYTISENSVYVTNGLTGPGVTEPFLRAVVFTILYSKSLPSNEIPTSNISSVLNPAFDGKIAFVGPSANPSTTYWLAGVNQTYFGGNSTKTEAFVKALAAMKPTEVSDFSTAAEDIVSGQDLVAIAYTQYIISDSACNCLAYVPLSPFLAQPSIMSLSAKPTHASAAELFLDFVYSESGGTVLAGQGEYTYYPGIQQNATLNWQSSYKVVPTPYISNSTFLSLQSTYEGWCGC
jgi:ABC-type Fe3+ transport system substrate-binding protein